MDSALSIPRFPTLEALKAESLRAHLMHGSGAVIVEQALSPVVAATDRHAIINLTRLAHAEGTLEGRDGTVRLWHRQMIDSGVGLNRLLSLDPLIKLVGEVIGGQAMLGSYLASIVTPGGLGVGRHRDWPYRTSFGMPENACPRQMPIMCVQVIIALDDFTAQNGATVVVPNSHDKLAKVSEEDFEREAVPVIMPAGGMLLFHGALLHGVQPNRTDKDRVGLLMGLHPAWVRPFSNGSDFGNIPDRAKHLLRHLLEVSAQPPT